MPNLEGLREEVGRIVDPTAWAFRDRHADNPIMRAECNGEVAPSLKAADAILALPALASLSTENVKLKEALSELVAVLSGTPMPDCASMNRLIAASAKARALLPIDTKGEGLSQSQPCANGTLPVLTDGPLSDGGRR